MVVFDRFADQTSGIRCQQAPRELRSSAMCRLLLEWSRGVFTWPVFGSVSGMLRSLGHHITGSRFEKCMAGLDSTTQAAASCPNAAFAFSIFPHLRIRFLAELHDPRPATVVRTASKIAPNSHLPTPQTFLFFATALFPFSSNANSGFTIFGSQIAKLPTVR